MASLRATRDAASFRDPSGFVFSQDGVLYRQVNSVYRDDYALLTASGLYEELVGAHLLVPHEEVSLELAAEPSAFKVLRPERVAFISYPYEWSFGQLKDAALTTLAIQRRALARGMTLKDASAYNVQLHQGRPTFIDTLSFERYEEGRPWNAYRQFCQHFLAPLALMSLTEARLGQLLRLYIDGVPLDLASRLLPWTTVMSMGLGLHVHAHAKAQKKHAGSAVKPAAPSKLRFSRRAFEGLVDSLEAAVQRLEAKNEGTEWAQYYAANNNYGERGLDEKRAALSRVLGELKPRTVWDLGANDGFFSRVAREHGAELIVSWDIDTTCVEANYGAMRARNEVGLVPLWLDLTNPSPGLGWANAERMSLADRGPADVVLALGLVHHLAISNNVPLGEVARYLAKLGKRLILEWVPKEDSQVQKLLATRQDIFPGYVQDELERAFAAHFAIESKTAISETKRTLYVMRSR